MDRNKKVVFMGTPEFACKTLEKLIESGYDVVACVTNVDKPSGRGMKLKPSPVKECAVKNNIPVLQPKKVKKNIEFIEKLKEYEPDFLVVVAYGKILPQEVLEIPKIAPINVHASLLPKYRGAAPMQWAIINGEKKTGVTTMFMDIGMDTGDMLLKEEIDISRDDNFGTIHDKLMNIGADLLIKTLDGLVDGSMKRQKQGEDFSVAPMINKEITKINFNQNSENIFNLVRGLSPFPGTYMECDNGQIYKVFSVENINDDTIDVNVENGKIVLLTKDKLYIKCNDGAISIKEIQPQNSRRMDIKSFLAGNKLNIYNKFI